MEEVHIHRSPKDTLLAMRKAFGKEETEKRILYVIQQLPQQSPWMDHYRKMLRLLRNDGKENTLAA